MPVMNAQDQEALAWQQAGSAARRLASKRVDHGTAFLDARLGKVWPWHMNLDRLDLGASCACVLGQLACDIVPKRRWLSSGGYRRFRPDYNHALKVLEMSNRKAQTHGFLGDDHAGVNHMVLAYAWRRRIMSRTGTRFQ